MALMYHFSMFFCLIAIFNYQYGREMNIKKALYELSQSPSVISSSMSTQIAQSAQATALHQLLLEQQGLFRQCINTFDHGILVGFAAYHAVYAGILIFGVFYV